MSDWEDLNAFVIKADEDAFARIVRRHAGLVHSAAQRLLRDRGAAEEVTQTVFVLLAERAAKLRPSGSLGAWLYQVACYQAKDLSRRESARQRREGTAALFEAMQNETLESHWEQIGPILDDAMQTLSKKEREALILRYFEKRPLREVGQALGVSEDAARKRVTRALERLRAWFRRHRVECSASVLGGVLGGFAVSGVSEQIIKATIQEAVSHTPVTVAGALAVTWPLVGVFLTSIAVPITLTKVSSVAAAPISADVTESVEVERTGLLALWDALRAEHGESMADLYGAIASLDDLYRKRVLRAVFITEWASSDPEGALRFFLTAEHGESFYSLFHECWKTCLKLDPERAIDCIVENREVFREKIGRVIDDVAVQRPSALPLLASFVPQKNPTDTRLLKAYMKAAESDFATARATLEELDGDAKREAAAGVAKAWAKKDGPAAWAWALGLEPSDVRGRVQRALLEGWAMTDPIAALALIDEAPEGGGYVSWLERGTASAVIGLAADHHLEAVLEWFAANPTSAGANAIGSSLAKRMYESTEEAVNTIDLVSKHPERLRLGKSLDVTLLNVELPVVLELKKWLADQPSDSFTSLIRNPIVSRLVWYAPDEAMSWANELVAEEAISEDDLSRIAASYVGLDSMNFENHLMLAGPDMRQALLRRAVPRLARMPIDLEAWDDHLLELPTELQPKAVSGLGSARAATDPRQALAWAERLPGEYQLPAVEGIAKTWAEADSHACSVWLADEEPGLVKDRAATALIQAIAEADRESAWVWTRVIQEEDSRDAAVRSILDGAPIEDARASLQSSSLPVEEKVRWHDYLDGKEDA